MKSPVFLTFLMFLCVRDITGSSSSNHVQRVTKCVIDTMENDPGCATTCQSQCSVPLQHVNCNRNCDKAGTPAEVRTCRIDCKSTGNVCNTGIPGVDYACRHIAMCICATCAKDCNTVGSCVRMFASMHACE